MTTLREFLQAQNNSAHAVAAGVQMHARLGRIFIDGDQFDGDADLVTKIRAVPTLCEFFGRNSRTEVPIAGFVSKRFISRRIDRLVIDANAKRILILDYKTDLDKLAFRAKYAAQLREYATLISAIYPSYHVSCYILWTHDWTLEKILK